MITWLHGLKPVTVRRIDKTGKRLHRENQHRASCTPCNQLIFAKAIVVTGSRGAWRAPAEAQGSDHWFWPHSCERCLRTLWIAARLLWTRTNFKKPTGKSRAVKIESSRVKTSQNEFNRVKKSSENRTRSSNKIRTGEAAPIRPGIPLIQITNISVQAGLVGRTSCSHKQCKDWAGHWAGMNARPCFFSRQLVCVQSRNKETAGLLGRKNTRVVLMFLTLWHNQSFAKFWWGRLNQCRKSGCNFATGQTTRMTWVERRGSCQSPGAKSLQENPSCMNIQPRPHLGNIRPFENWQNTPRSCGCGWRCVQMGHLAKNLKTKEERMQFVKKRTKWMTNSSLMANVLSARCRGRHTHSKLEGSNRLKLHSTGCGISPSIGTGHFKRLSTIEEGIERGEPFKGSNSLHSWKPIGMQTEDEISSIGV